MSQHQEQKLSEPIENLITTNLAWQEYDSHSNHPPHFDLLIIGSGYGGAVAAARFARAKENSTTLKIAVLERGREILPGDFPNSFAQLVGDVRISRHNSDKLTGNAEALFDFRINETVNVLLGNGLGGGSLINAAVAEAPHPDVWTNAHWPRELKNETTIAPYLERAREFLGTEKIDACGAEQPIKLTSMKKLGDAIGGNHYRTVEIAIDLQRCVQCGDCVTGCNFNAKNTLPKTYLAHARTNDVKLYTGATVSHIRKLTQRLDNGDTSTEWLVYFVLTYGKGHPSQQQMWVLKTRHLILSAGALGSTEILQRSAAKDTSLIFSGLLGKRFSCNGDMIWNGYDQAEQVNAVADPEQNIDQRKVGPTIASMIDLREADNALAGGTPHVIQDASIPAALKRVFEEIVTSNAVSYRMIKRDQEERSPWQDVDAVDPEKIRHTATYLSMGIDQAKGELKFKQGTPKSNTGLQGKSVVHWGDEDKKSPLPDDKTDNVCNDPVYSAAERRLRQVKALGGTLLPSPNYRIGPKELLEQLSGKRALKSTLTVHPLGGCGMGNDSQSGVVNHYGAVFDGNAQAHQHEGLYVLDGAIVPCALGINPLLSISGLAERAIEHIAQRERWDLLPLASKPAVANDHIDVKKLAPAQPEKLGFTFQEVMRCEPNKNAEQRLILDQAGLSQIQSMQLIVEFHIQERNLAAFLRNPKRNVTIAESTLVVQLRNGSRDEFKLAGNVHWLWEGDDSADQKEKSGLTRYLRSRALADLTARTDLSVLTKWMLRGGITILNKFDLVLPNFALRFLEFLSSTLGDLFHLASHTGGHRLLRYQLQSDDGKAQIKGLKDVNFGDGSNLWRSLSQLKTQLHYQNKQVEGLHFCLDWNEIFEANSLQLDPPKQGAPRNPDIWLDIFSIFSFWARALGRIHFWSFRLPDVQSQTRRPRLPELAASPDSRWYPLSLIDNRGNPCQIGLTHFPAKNAATSLPPLLMLHGFGASGLQFAAPGNQISMVEHFLTNGRDVWVAELRTSIAMNRELDDKLAQWSMDEVAKNDIPVLVAEVLKRTQSNQVDVLAHCIGSAMFNIAVLAGKLMHSDCVTSLIRRAALLQVGPIFSVSENNKLRGYFAYFAGRGFDIDFIDSSTDADSEDATNTLVDRMLATYPVPLSELQGQEKEKCLFPVHPGNQWQANYYRSSGVFGRLFSIHQLSLEMLNQLGDLLGRTNFKTFQQIIHCVMRNRLVDADGRNCYVTADKLRQFYGFPTRFFYGEDNDVFAREGIVHSVTQLRSAHGWKEGRDEASNDSPYSYQTFPHYGHLDPIIGKNAACDIYPSLSAFLNDEQSSLTDSTHPESLYIRKPLYGPVVGWTRKAESGTWISRIWIAARETAGRPLYAMVYRYSIERGIYDLKLLPIQNLLRFQYITIDVHLQNKEETIYISCLHQGSQDGSGLQFNEITCDHFDALQHQHASRRPRPTKKETQRVPQPLDVLSDIARFDGDSQTELEEHLQININRLPEYKAGTPRCRCSRVRPRTSSGRTLSRIALGSCRYSGTTAEQVRNNAAYVGLLDTLKTDYAPALMLLMGDQVYVDATAGVADPSDIASIMSLYHRSLAQRYNNKFFAAAQVFSQLPAYMMLDDHEINDNWNSHEVIFDAHEQERCEMAIAAFLSHQWSHGARNNAGHPHYWTQFETEHINFFMLDTRLERTPAQPGYQNQLISDAQFIALERWLNDTRDQAKLRLVISPSQLHNLEDEHILRSDAWSAYPNCLVRLATLLENQRHVGILCGDQHLHGLYSLDYHNAQGDLSRKITVIVASPLYAPYPFANPRNDIAANTCVPIAQLSDSTKLSYRLLASNGCYQGFSQLVVEAHEQGWRANIYQVDGVTPLFGEANAISF